MMEYKDYIGAFEFDGDDRTFHGRVINIRDVVTFEGKSVEELSRAFEDSVDDYLAFCRRRGETPDIPYSGKFVTRLAPKLHRLASLAAMKERKSLNAWIGDLVVRAVDVLGPGTVPVNASARKRSTSTSKSKRRMREPRNSMPKKHGRSPS